MPRPLFSVALNTLTRTLSEDDLRQIAASGIECLEVGARMFDNDAGGRGKSGVKALASQGGPRVRSIHAGDGDVSALHDGVWRRALDESAECIELAQELGATQIVFHPSEDRIPPEQRKLRMERSVQAFARLAPVARRCGVRIAVEALPRTCLGNTVDELVQILETLPADVFGVCIDTNHLMTQHVILPDNIRRLGGRLLEIHASDYDGIDEKHEMPGTGVVAWPAVMKALGDVGFAGPFNYEVGFGPIPLAERIRSLEENFRWLCGLANSN